MKNQYNIKVGDTVVVLSRDAHAENVCTEGEQGIVLSVSGGTYPLATVRLNSCEEITQYAGRFIQEHKTIQEPMKYTTKQLLAVRFHTSANNPLIFQGHGVEGYMRICHIDNVGTDQYNVWSIKDINYELNDPNDPWVLDSPINETTPTKPSAMSAQVGGTHYKDLGVQPLELTLKNMSFEAFEGACYTKINKYMIRNKDNKVEQLQKAKHVLEMWIEEAENQAKN